jgi:cobalt-zinc-cadmium resistance protein CzcA
VAIHDRSDLVQSTLRTVSHVLVAGFVIVITVLLVFLLSVRAALLTALIIPLSCSSRWCACTRAACRSVS